MLASWVARHNTWLLIKLTPKGVIFSFIILALPCLQSYASRTTQTKSSETWKKPASYFSSAKLWFRGTACMAVPHLTEPSKTSALTWTKLPNGEGWVLGPKRRLLGASWSGMGLLMGLIICLSSWSAIGGKLCLFCFSCVLLLF